MKHFVLAGILCVIFASSSLAQEAAPDKPKEGFIRIINASTIVMPEPWRAGVDLTFKDQTLARDMRGGEGASYKSITFVGKDSVDVMPTGKTNKVGSVPASFEKGGFYTIILTGTVTESDFNVTPVVALDFPVPPGKVRQGFGRVKVFNAVTSFPVSLKVDEGTPSKLESMDQTELFLNPGTHRYALSFPYKGQQREMQGLLIVTAGTQYTAAVFASPEKPDRPVLRLWDDSQQMTDALEEAEAAKKEKSGEAPVESSGN